MSRFRQIPCLSQAVLLITSEQSPQTHDLGSLNITRSSGQENSDRRPKIELGESMLTNIVAVVSRNSTDFVKVIFDLYAKGRPFVILKDRDQLRYLDGVEITEIIEPKQEHGWIDHKPSEFRDSDEPAQITFTSGTEGIPKGIVLSYRALNDVVQRLCEISQIDSSIREYVGVPAGYSFGLGRYRVCAAVGGRTYLPPNGFDPVELVQMLREDEINAISAVPTLWKSVLEYPELFVDVKNKVKWIEIGSQYMPREDKEQLKLLFPCAKIIQHYGLTEASRSTFLDISATEGEALESVGRATGDTQIRISADGLIEVKGPHVATGSFIDGELKAITDHEGWLRTNDKGKLRNGYLFYSGRSDDLINCGGIKVIPESLEAELYKSLGIHSGIAIGRFSHPMRGDGILVAIEKFSKLSIEQVRIETSRLLETQGLRVGDALRLIKVDKLPRTPTGKLQRRLLQDDLAEQDKILETKCDTNLPKTDIDKSTNEIQDQLVHIWKRVLKTNKVSLDESFYSSGGDSLSAISMMLTLEKEGIEKRITTRIFDGETIREIVAFEMKGESIQRPIRLSERVTGDVINIVRGILVLLLIGIHFLPGVWERLPIDAERVNALLHPFYRLGTPGFALVFGLGVGFFYFNQMSAGTSHAWRRVKLSALLVGTGVLILGLFSFVVAVSGSEEMPSPLFSSIFYSVLVYYLLAVLSIPIWYRLVYKEKSPVVAALTAAVVSYLIYLVLDRSIGPKPLSFGPAELARLMLEAKYNYFRMTSIVMIGVAIGLHFRKQTDLNRAAGNYLTLGLLTLTTMLMVPYDMGRQLDRWLTMQDAELFAILGYTGVILMLLGVISWVRPRVVQHSFAGISLRCLAACGVLSLPAYIAHGLVIPAKEIIVNLTPVPESIALLGSLGLLFLVGFFAIRKVVRLYG